MTKSENLQPAAKKVYAAPNLKEWGTVADLTKTGLTNSGDDGKIGSIGHSKGV